jgi:hypothetical protein
MLGYDCRFGTGAKMSCGYRDLTTGQIIPFVRPCGNEHHLLRVRVSVGQRCHGAGSWRVIQVNRNARVARYSPFAR